MLISMPAYSGMIDLSSVGSSAQVNGAIFLQISPSIPAGSGTWNSFLKLQAKTTTNEMGYNTNGSVPNSDKNKGLKEGKAIQVGNIPILIYGGVAYREFCLDVSQNNSGFLSLDQLKFHLANTGNKVGYPNSELGPAIFDLSVTGNWIKMKDRNPGNGRADLAVLIPSSLFGSDNAKYVYLFSELGANCNADNGYEEWGIGTGGTLIPEPATLAILGLGAAVIATRRKK